MWRNEHGSECKCSEHLSFKFTKLGTNRVGLVEWISDSRDFGWRWYIANRIAPQTLEGISRPGFSGRTVTRNEAFKCVEHAIRII